jgi:hypothetical protein
MTMSKIVIYGDRLSFVANLSEAQVAKEARKEINSSQTINLVALQQEIVNHEIPGIFARIYSYRNDVNKVPLLKRFFILNIIASSVLNHQSKLELGKFEELIKSFYTQYQPLLNGIDYADLVNQIRLVNTPAQDRLPNQVTVKVLRLPQILFLQQVGPSPWLIDTESHAFITQALAQFIKHTSAASFIFLNKLAGLVYKLIFCTGFKQAEINYRLELLLALADFELEANLEDILNYEFEQTVITQLIKQNQLAKLVGNQNQILRVIGEIYAALQSELKLGDKMLNQAKSTFLAHPADVGAELVITLAKLIPIWYKLNDYKFTVSVTTKPLSGALNILNDLLANYYHELTELQLAQLYATLGSLLQYRKDKLAT